jgi:hypothetical protein
MVDVMKASQDSAAFTSAIERRPEEGRWLAFGFGVAAMLGGLVESRVCWTVASSNQFD